jgi:ribosomal protein L14E/L6E/L27E
VLAGRYAGRKAVIVKASEDGNDKKRFGHAIGIHLRLHNTHRFNYIILIY